MNPKNEDVYTVLLQCSSCTVACLHILTYPNCLSYRLYTSIIIYKLPLILSFP